MRRMEVQLSPEVEAEITRRAASTGKPPAQVVGEILATALADEAQFRAEVRLAIEQADRGECIEHEQIIARSNSGSARSAYPLPPQAAD